jgi:hypothetical protein
MSVRFGLLAVLEAKPEKGGKLGRRTQLTPLPRTTKLIWRDACQEGLADFSHLRWWFGGGVVGWVGGGPAGCARRGSD